MDPIIIMTIMAASVWTVSVLAGLRATLEVERTIRAGIERGTLTDPAMIAALREPAGLRWIERFALFSIVIASSGTGLCLVALAFVVTGIGVPTPLFVFAMFLIVIAGGFFLCSRWLRRERSRP